MRRFFATPIAAVSVIAFTQIASAADLPRKAPPAPPPPAPVYNWTGCYLGAGVGYGMYNRDNQTVSNGTYAAVGPTIAIAISAPAGTALGGNETFGGRGWLVTGQFGCDYQFAGPWGNWVVGAFVDGDWSNIHRDESLFVSAWTGEERLRRSWAVGGRIGWLVTPTLLSYFSGGFTQARFDEVNYVLGITTAMAQGGLAVAATPGATFQLPSHTFNGFFIGGGVEYQLGWLPGLAWKTEYRFADYRSATTLLTCVSCTLSVGVAPSQQVHPYVQTVRSELVWRFNWR